MVLLNGRVVLRRVYAPQLTHSSVGGRSGCSRVVAVVSSAALSIRGHASFQVRASSGCVPSSGVAGSCDNCFQCFEDPPLWLYQFTFLPTVQEGSFFSTPSQRLLFVAFLVVAVLTDMR